MTWVTRDNVISWTLAFVIGWFGIHEIFQPSDWIVFAPSFLGSGSLVIISVVIHGIILVVCGFFLIFNYHRRLVSSLLVFMLAEILFELMYTSGISDVVVRDIGLLGMAIANSITSE